MTAVSPPSRVSQRDPESPSLGKPPTRAPVGSWARRTGFRRDRDVNNGGDVEINMSHTSKPADVSVPGPINPAMSRTTKTTGDLDVIRKSSSLPVPIDEPRGILKNQVQDDDDGLSMWDGGDDGHLAWSKHSHMKYELRESPGLGPGIFYAIQHYLSMAGSLVLIPLVLVPAMGGTPEDTSKVVASMLMVSGLSTLLHTSFGSRLPLIQGASFVYLAPALAITLSPDFANLSKDRFKTTMRELQGAIIIASAFQALLGYSGATSLCLRAINPVVVAPTIASLGLAFYAYGFAIIGRCVEIGIPQLVLLLLFALYLRKITTFGHRIFQVYAVPMAVALTWAFALLLTESKMYTYPGCSLGQQGTDTTLTPACQKQMSTMLTCRTDVSNALATSSWFRFPYPFQWGFPTFHWQTAVVMAVASVIASVDSVGVYHATSLLVASRAPPPGVVSRGLGLEGLTNMLAGCWGTGSGATTLTENVHTIATTKMGSRRPLEYGACILILLSIVGKVSGFIAQIPLVIVAALLVFMWTMLAAMGLSNLRYSETGSSRNVLIVGLSLFLALSVPSYFQQYAAHSSSPVPSYFQPYNVAAHGPFHTSSAKVNFALNSVFSLHMVIAFLVALVLENTVPGSRRERGLYVWSSARTACNEPAVVKDYGLPFGLRRFFLWVRWVGL